MTFVATTARSRAVHGYGRLDANFYTSPGVAASEKVGLLEAAGLSVVGLRQVADRVWDPSRFARTYASVARLKFAAAVRAAGFRRPFWSR